MKEVISESKSFTYQVTPETIYSKLVPYVAAYYGITAPQEREILVQLCNCANKGKLSLTASKRKRLCEYFHIQSQQFSRALVHLKDVGILSGDKGEYQLCDALALDNIDYTKFKVSFEFKDRQAELR
jgi:hypothetical protein